MNNDTNHYDIYAKVGEEVVLIDDTTVDLSGYVTSNDLNTKLNGKVDKVDGKELSSNDYTDIEKSKLAGIQEGANKVEVSSVNGNIKINGSETTVYTEPSDVIHGSIATDAEISEMLSEVFGA